MRDLQLSRLINVVAVGSLMVTATGCGPTPRSASRKMCKAMRSCDKEAFNEEYDSLGECIDTQEEYFDHLEDYSKECADAGVEFMICFSKEMKKSCGEDYDELIGECLSEAVEFFKACGYSDYSDYDSLDSYDE